MKVEPRASDGRRLASHVVLAATIAACAVTIGGCRRVPTKAELFQRGQAFAARGQHAEAVLEFRRALQVDPKYGEARYELAHAYLKQKDIRRAAGELVRAADLMPNNVAAKNEAAQVLLLSEQFEDARTRAEHVLQVDPKNITAQLVKGSAQAGLKEFDTALQAMETAARSDPDSAMPLIALGLLRADRGQLADAEATLTHAVEIAPRSAEALIALANFYFAANRPKDAETPLTRAAEVDPQSIAAQRALAAYYVLAGRPQDAEAPLKALVRLEPGASSELTLADYYVRTGRPTEAVALMKHAATSDGGFASATTRLAVLDFQNGRKADAYRALEAVLAKSPKNTEALVAKARCLMADLKQADALIQAKAAVDSDPRSSAAFLLLGTVNASLGKTDDATAAFNEVLKLKPKDVTARVELVQAQLRTRAWSQALATARELSALAPRNPAARAMLAMAQAMNGDPDTARAGLQDLAAQVPNVPMVHAQLGGRLLATKDIAGANREFERALVLDPTSAAGLRGIVAVNLSQARGTTEGDYPRLERFVLGLENVPNAPLAANNLAWLEVLGRVKAGSVTVVEAATLLGVSYRQAKRLWRRFKQGGATALRHRQAGRPSNRGTAARTRQRVLRLIREKYSGDVATRFGPTLVAEHLASEDGLTVDHETVRRWMLAAGLWSRQRTRTPYRQRRVRKAHFGELVQLDGSFHAWYEDRGPRRCLITMVDDATSQSTGRFSDEETIWAVVAVLRDWIGRHGVPHALYTDWKNVYVSTGTAAELAAGVVPRTQFGRMCAALGIQIIPASSPQAKGRVERNHGTHQDRLVKKLRRAGIQADGPAQAFLATTYWPQHNARFAQAPAATADFHRRSPSATVLDRVFRLEVTRTVGLDWVVRYHNRALQLARQSRYAPARSTVTVCEWPDGHLAIEYRGRAVPWTEVAAQPVPPPAPPPPAIVAPRLTPSGGAAVDHPWRRSYKELRVEVPLWRAFDR